MKLHPFVFWSLVILSSVVIWGWFSSRLILNVPRLPDYATPKNIQRPFEEISFKSGNRLIAAWFIPSKANHTEKTVIICHGWGASKGDLLLTTSFLLDHFNLLYFDFTNHGESGGNKTSMGKYEAEDIVSAVDYLKKYKKKESQNVGVYGFSMGASVAIYATSKDKRINALIAESPFYSFNEIVAHYAKTFLNMPPRPFADLAILFSAIRLGFFPEKYAPSKNVQNVSPAPILIIGASGDKNIPLHIVKKVFEKSSSPKELKIFESTGHGSTYSDHKEEYKNTLISFFKKHL